MVPENVTYHIQGSGKQLFPALRVARCSLYVSYFLNNFISHFSKMSSPLDSSLCRELADHIETLTHTGLKSLDSSVMKKVKRICKLSDGYVEHAHHLVMFQLGRPHAEIRYSAFQIIDELFRRSHCFRELLVSNMQRLMELAVETSPEFPLPPPRTAALSLKRTALRSIREWNDEFGDAYKKLRLGYNYLKHCKKVDFSALQMEDTAQRMREQELERRQNVINQERLKKVQTEMDEIQPEINGTLTAMENCFGLLMPAPEDFFIAEESATPAEVEPPPKALDAPSTSKASGDVSEKQSSDSEYETDEEVEFTVNMNAHGMFNPNFKIELELKPEAASIKETPENAAIFENVRDLHTLIINRYLPCIKRWEQMITKSSGSADLLKKVIDLKQALEDALKKFSQLNVKSMSTKGDDSSDSDFEEVEEKEGFEEKVDAALPPAAPVNIPIIKKTEETEKGWSIWSKENDAKDPTSAQSTLATLAPAIKPAEKKAEVKAEKKNVVAKQAPAADAKPSTSSSESDRKSKLLAIAPKLPFDVDLYHWEDENITAPTMLSVKPEGARFWSATSNDDLEEIPVPEGVASLRTRVIEFSGKYEPVKWACRAPMKSGKLCPRRDRYKCPFHGRIVPRDETGQCVNPEDVARLKQEEQEEQEERPDWQDPELLADIKANTGIDLKMPEKKKDGKRRKKKEEKPKYPGLTDISASENTAHTRLAKKVFKKSAMKRVALALDKADHKRFRDKFGDQFNYVYN